MSRDDPQMKIRMPPQLKADIEGAADANRRTMNAEIVARLQASFSKSVLDMLGPEGDLPEGMESFSKTYQPSKAMRMYLEQAVGPVVRSVLDQHLEEERKLRAHLYEQITGSEEIRKLASGERAAEEIQKRLVRQARSAGPGLASGTPTDKAAAKRRPVIRREK